MNIASDTSARSFREKSAWISFFLILVVFVPYFVHVYRLEAAADLRAATIVRAFVLATVVFSALQIVLHIIVALRTRQERWDERDMLIELKSFRVAYGFLATGVFVFAALVVIGASSLAGPALWLRPVLLSQMFLFCFILAEAGKYLTQAICYRRGS